ncbi:MAG: F0F1 ATP synthase subunit epsilon [Chloroflexi bacterium]|nr:F0F1 ATP synthase subunit epsilon [Chloroflexota bacterium]MCI0580647.1 F0F1 ATP synthase subunit epsilon [Chloroflexota bacterium]MCI0648663.1 F0F1 ATP synthase subunit epsilon [Chloroflexota bacterium]MCI0728071.1 F0F1 ATP synthase subunit epsilon [Chloroflexota bacterium]
MPLQCDIVTQERSVFSGQVDYVSLPGTEGRMGILPNHSPLLTALGFGEVMVRQGGQEEFFAIGGGFAEIRPSHVIVLADSAEHAEEIDIDRAQQAREAAERAMREAPKDTERYAQIEAELRRAQIRIDVSLRRASGMRRRRMPMTGLRGEEENE